MFRNALRPSPAMIVACIALVAALGGNAIADGVNAVAAALKPNSVTSKTVKNGSLKLADFNKKEAAKLKGKTGATGAAGAAGPQGPAGTPNGYTKAEADAAFLGKTAQAADSAKLGGNSASTFVQGGGTQGFTSRLMSQGDTDASLGTIQGIGTLTAGCDALGNMHVRVDNDQATTVRMSYEYTREGLAEVIDGRQITAGNFFDFNFSNDDTEGTFQFTKTTGSGLFTQTSAATVKFSAVNDPVSDAGKCRWQTQVQTGQSGLSFVILLP